MNIIVHGEGVVKKDLRKIEVRKHFDSHFDLYDVGHYDYKALGFDQIELVCRDYAQANGEKGYDLIFACHSDDRSRNLLYLGYWNDGVV